MLQFERFLAVEHLKFYDPVVYIFRLSDESLLHWRPRGQWNGSIDRFLHICDEIKKVLRTFELHRRLRVDGYGICHA